MLPPMLFYALGFALVFFGVLRLFYLGLRAPKTTPHEEEEVKPQKQGFGLLTFMGGGRMAASRRHKVMGGLWIVMGLYVMWTGVVQSRSQVGVRPEASVPAEPVRVIRSNVQTPEAAQGEPQRPPPGQNEGDGRNDTPTLKAAPEPPATGPAGTP